MAEAKLIHVDTYSNVRQCSVHCMGDQAGDGVLVGKVSDWRRSKGIRRVGGSTGMEEVLPLDWVTWVICCEDCDVFDDIMVMYWMYCKWQKSTGNEAKLH